MRQLDTAVRLSGSDRGVQRGLTGDNSHPCSPGLVRGASLLLICSFAIFLSTAPARADGGSLSGTVKDPSGAAIMGAVVTARNLETGVQQTVKTNESGFYTIPTLPVGHYEMEASFQGFRPYRRTGLLVDVNRVLGIDVTMEMGEQSSEITVSGSGLHVET